MVLFIVFLVIHCLFKVALQNNLMQRLSLVQVLPRFVKELLLSWHSNDWFKERVLVDYPWLCAGLCKATQCPSVHSRLQCPLKAIVPIQGHNALSTQCPFKAAMPTQGHCAHSRPQRPLKATTPSQAHSAHTRPQYPFKAAMPTQGHSAHSRPQCPHKAIVSMQRMGELTIKQSEPKV